MAERLFSRETNTAREDTVQPNQSDETVTGVHGDCWPRPALVIGNDSLLWQRRLTPRAWTALQHLALRSRRTQHGWAAAVGVRDVAAGIGVTKDTAARAISALVTAGLVTRQPVEKTGGSRRSGYLLHLPRTMRLIDDPNQSRRAHHGEEDPPGAPDAAREIACGRPGELTDPGARP
jgi:DNA-binding MarR family transcriptional regulator